MVNFKLRGLVPPVFTPFNEDFSLNLKIIPSYVKYLKSKGVKGILVNGTTGEGVCMTSDERMRVTEEWMKYGKEEGIHVMVQVGGGPLPQVLQLAQHAEKCGEDSLLTLPELFFKPNTVTDLVDYLDNAQHAEKCGADSLLTLPELFFKPNTVTDLVDYLDNVSGAAPNTPLLYYHIPALSNVNLNMALMVSEAQKRVKTFRGVKLTTPNLEDATDVLKVCTGDTTAFLGCDKLIAASSVIGMESSIGTTFNMLYDHAASITRDNVPKQRELNDIVDIITKYGTWVPTMKVAMKILSGIDVGPVRAPNKNLTQDQVKQMTKELQQIMKKK